MKTIYGWSQEEQFYLDYADGTEKEYKETLHVFPKYDELFFDSDLEQSIILSYFDELLGVSDKIEMREVYEELYGGFGKGKTRLLMTEPYLFALKHEIERRQYLGKLFNLTQHSKKETFLRLSAISSYEDLRLEISNLIDEFIQTVKEKVSTHQAARDVERQRFQGISTFLQIWKGIYLLEITELEKILSDEGLLEKFNNTFHMFSQPFEYVIDKELMTKNLKKELSKNQENFFDDKVKKNIVSMIYSIEKYNLDNFATALAKDEEFIRNSVNFRHQISKRIHQILRELDVDSILFASLKNAGIRE